VKHWPYHRYVAHRGAGKLAPENTLAAMRRGLALGYRMVEFDVKLSADGVAFLLHDETLDRTTNGSGRADALGWRELSQLDAGSWHSTEYAGEPLPTLACVARWAIANEVLCNVEIKPMPGRERETGAAVAVDVAALWRGQPVQPLISSFSEESLAAANTAVPNLVMALLVSRVPADWLTRLQTLGCIALDTDHRELHADVVSAIHKAGLRVLSYTPNDAKVVDRLARWGVDGIITDAIDRIAPDGSERTPG